MIHLLYFNDLSTLGVEQKRFKGKVRNILALPLNKVLLLISSLGLLIIKSFYGCVYSIYFKDILNALNGDGLIASILLIVFLCNPSIAPCNYHQLVWSYHQR